MKGYGDLRNGSSGERECAWGGERERERLGLDKKWNIEQQLRRLLGAWVGKAGRRRRGRRRRREKEKWLDKGTADDVASHIERERKVHYYFSVISKNNNLRTNLDVT